MTLFNRQQQTGSFTPPHQSVSQEMAQSPKKKEQTLQRAHKGCQGRNIDGLGYKRNLVLGQKGAQGHG